MSALAHYLEDEGLATAAIVQVREHAEQVRPPRALSVPYELGRPLGEPGDPAFQRRVLLALLGLLVREDGPGMLVDYEEQSANSMPDPRWQPPVDTARWADDFDTPWDAGEALEWELARLRPSHTSVAQRLGQTSVGVSRLGEDRAAKCIAAYAAGEPMASPFDEISDLLLMRYAADDLKAYYLEAATAGDGRPNSTQLSDWLWRETILSKVLMHIRGEALAGDDKRAKTVAGRFLVPPPRAEALS